MRLLPGVLRLLQLLVDRFALDRIGAAVLGRAQPVDLGPERVGPLGEDAAEPRVCARSAASSSVGEPRLVLADRGQHRLQPLDFAVLARAEHRLDNRS